MAKVIGTCQNCGCELKGGFGAFVIDSPHQDYSHLCYECGGIKREVEEARSQIKLMTIDLVPEGMQVIGLAIGATARARGPLSGIGAGLQQAIGGEVSINVTMP